MQTWSAQVNRTSPDKIALTLRTNMTSRVRRARSYNLATTLQLKRSGIRSDVIASKTAVSTSCTFIRRLALTNTLDYHDGCVNTIEV